MRWMYQGNVNHHEPFEVLILTWHSGRSVTVVRPEGGEPFETCRRELRGVVDNSKKLP